MQIFLIDLKLKKLENDFKKIIVVGYTYDFNCCIVDKRWYETKSLSANDLYEKSCLNRDDFENYFRNKKTMKKCGYAIHISQLEIFDTPKELSEFGQYGYEWFIPVEKAPQNYCYIETDETR